MKLVPHVLGKQRGSIIYVRLQNLRLSQGRKEDITSRRSSMLNNIDMKTNEILWEMIVIGNRLSWTMSIKPL